MTYVKINDVLIGDERILFRSITESPDYEYSENKYAGYDGADYDNITFPSRPVTVNGTLYGKSYSDIEELKLRLTNACNPKKEVELRYFNGHTEYYAKATPSFPVFAKVNNYTYQFAINLDISKFYWLSADEISQAVYRSIDNVYGSSITFPRPLSILEQGADIYNRGNVDAPVIIEILASEAFTDTITVENVTQQKKIVLENYSFAKDEIITIDTDARTVTSSVNGNIISYLSEASELFYLPTGYTRIICDRAGIIVTTRYRERFLEVC